MSEDARPDTTITALKMARALRGSLENGCEVTVKDLDILIDTMLDDDAAAVALNLVRELCADPDMWATHGCPGEQKLGTLERRIAEALREFARDKR